MAAAVLTKRPAPMMAPIPSATSDIGPSVRLSVASPVPATSCMRRSIDLVRNNAPATMYPSQSVDVRRRNQGPAGRRSGSVGKTTRLYAAARPTRPLDRSLRRSRKGPNRDLRKRRRPGQQRGTSPGELLIEKLTNDDTGDRGDARRCDRAENRALAERSSPERHVTEVEMPCVANVDPVVRECGARIDRIARAEAALPRRVDH